MLVLTRKLGERIRIGDSIVLTIVQCKLGVVKLGIEAPREVTILRTELQPRRNAAHPDKPARSDLARQTTQTLVESSA